VVPHVQIAPFGGDSVLITLGDRVDVPALGQALRSEFPSVRVRVGLESVLVTGTELPNADSVQQLLSQPIQENQESGTHHLIPVVYDGEDLAAVADVLGHSMDSLITLHTNIQWQVALLGFAPGFPYLNPLPGLDRVFDRVPRLPSPRTQVPAGSVAVAAGMSCIYPNALPGGWNLLGHTTVRLFDPANTSRPSLMAVGDLVQFTVAVQ
jgi:KipI family sensor histidine kinase inhibitor